MKRNKVTLITLFIIIIICFAIISVCLYILNESKEISKLKKYVSQMELIQEKVNKIRNEYKFWENYNPNQSGNFISYLQSLNFSNANSSANIYLSDFNRIIDELNQKNLDFWNVNTDSIITNYCYFNPDSLNKSLGLENVNLYVIINFYTGNVISKDGVKDSGKIIYRQYDSRFGNKLVVNSFYKSEVTPVIEIVENAGLSQKVKISFDNKDINEVAEISEIYYYSSPTDTIRKKCSNLSNYQYLKDEKAAYFTIDVSGEYSFIVEDTNFVQYPAIIREFSLCNPPILMYGMKGIYWDDENNEKEISSENDSNWYDYSKNILKMANAKTEDGNYWVWIPRFIYLSTKEEKDVEFVQNKTLISTRNESRNTYKLHESFSEDGNVTGFWIAKFQANFERENYISMKPGNALSILSVSKVQSEIAFLNRKNNTNYLLMSEKERQAVMFLSEANSIQVSNDLVHYAGGAPNENGYKTNSKYSSTGNVYGVYDLISSENEITRNANDEGRFRETIKIFD